MYRTVSTSSAARAAMTLSLLIMLIMLLAACGGTAGTQTQSQGPGQAPQSGTPTQAPAGSTSTNSGKTGQQAQDPGAPTSAPPAAGDAKDWSGVDVCKLLPKQEIEAVVGPIGNDQAPDPEYSAAIDGRASCRFNNTNQVPVALLAIGPLVMWDAEKRAVTEEGLNPQDFSGAGDDAITFGHSLIARWLGKGVTIEVTLYIQDPFDPNKAKQLAEKVYERLP